MKFRTFFLIGVLAVAACSENPTSLRVAPEQIAASAGIGAKSLGGCYDPTDPQCSHTPPAGDPSPTASGVHLGPDFTPAACTAPLINDGDADSFHDFCEFQLALAFRPLLSVDPLDEGVSRESYWATLWDGNQIAMAYLIGYHFDNGNDHATVCQGSTHMYCLGHFGDAEFVIIRAEYNAVTQHWAVVNATTSAHWGEDDAGMCPWLPFTRCDYTLTRAASSFEYPTKLYHYPRVYVSLDKHANYQTRSSCNDGGAYDSDDCTYNQDLARVDVHRYRNVGQSWSPLIQGVQSQTNPTLYYGTEYYFNNGAKLPFCGWDGPSVTNGRGNCAKAGYEKVLRDLLEVSI